MYLKEKTDIGSPNYDVDFLETLVYEWLRRSMYFKHFRLSNSILKSIALRFKAILNLKSFKATNEWLQKFRLTYNLKNGNTLQVRDIGYKSNKSTIPADIFNELQPKWASLDPTSAVLNSNLSNESEKIMNDIDDTEFLDIEDELPVCTIFGRKTVENVAKIISSNTNPTQESFQPMIVCTDPKNPNLTLMTQPTPEKSVFNSINIPEANKIKDLITGNPANTDSSSPSQNEYIDEYLKEIVRVPKTVKIIYKGPSNQDSLKPSETNCETQIFKPISLSKSRRKKNNTIKESESIDTESSNKNLSTKPNRKRKAKASSDKLTHSMNIETITVDEGTTEMQSTKPTVLQQAWDQTIPSSIITPSNTTATFSEAQPSQAGAANIMYTIQMPPSNQNQLTMSYISSIATNQQLTQLGQSGTLTPIVLHFQSPLTASDVVNLTQTPSIPQTPLIPSIDLTQNSNETNLTNCTKSQFIQPIQTNVQPSLLPAPTPTIAAIPTISTTSTLHSATPAVISSGLLLPTNFTTINMEQPKTQHFQTPTSTKQRTIAPKTQSTVSSSVPTRLITCMPNNVSTIMKSPLSTKESTVAYLPNFVQTQNPPATLTRTQQLVVTQPPSIPTSSTSSALTTLVCLPSSVPTKVAPIPSTRIQQPVLPKAPGIISPQLTSTGGKSTTPMPVTPVNKSNLQATAVREKKVTKFAQRAPLRSQAEVMKCMKLMEDFAMMNENFRLIGFLERLEQLMSINQ